MSESMRQPDDHERHSKALIEAVDYFRNNAAVRMSIRFEIDGDRDE